MVFTIPSCMGQTLIVSHRFSFLLLVEVKGYLYRGIGRTYVSLPGRAGGLPVLIISMNCLIIECINLKVNNKNKINNNILAKHSNETTRSITVDNFIHDGNLLGNTSKHIW